MRILSILLFAFLTENAFGAFLTVSNTPTIPAQYTTLAEALEAANDNDTIYINASPLSYGGTTLNKSVHIIGAGHTDTFNRGITRFTSGFSFADAASGSTVQGIYFLFNATYFTIQANGNVSNITFSRCRFRENGGSGSSSFLYTGFGTATITNWIIRQSIFEYIDDFFYLNGNTLLLNLNFENNLFAGGFGEFMAWNSINDQDIVVFRNNTFLSSSRFDGVSACLFENNIFLDEPNDFCSTCTYSNNVFAECTVCEDLNTSNIVGQSPQFVNLPDGVDIINNLDEVDLNLTPGSPGSQAGLDGNDVGIFGGGFPMNLESAYGSIPKVPYVYSFLLANPVVGVGNDLEYTIEVQSAK